MMVTAGLTLATPGFTQQPQQINACGIVTQPGNYQVGEITAQGNGDCLVVDGPNIQLGGIAPSSITGTGKGTAIHFTSRAKNSGMTTGAEWGINRFRNGVVIEANGVQLDFTYGDNFVIYDCTIGIQIKGGRGVVVKGGTFPNGGGIELNTARIGVWVTGHTSHDTISGSVNQKALQPPPVGIEVERSASDITVDSNSTEGEMVDRHKNCRTDVWQNNTFVSANQSCIH